MLAPTQTDRRFRSNIEGGEKFSMGIHEDALTLVMESLAGLYSDQITAMLREYATNAIDAHKMAGNPAPIRVTLPTRFEPKLTIQDFGIGLDADDLREIYSQYGASTKRQSNDFNGMLGFGCKSALAYADVFNITSVKDGYKVFCSVAKGAELPEFHVIDRQPTTEPNGTTVTIPVAVSDVHSFTSKAQKLYSYFEPGTVLINDTEPAPFAFDEKVDDNTFITKSPSPYSEQQSYIVMGNVPYPVDLDHGLAKSYGIVARVPIGSVEFAPSREGLKVHKPATKQTITALETRLQKHFRTVVQRDIDAAATPREAIESLHAWRSRLSFEPSPAHKPLTYKGRAIPSVIEAGTWDRNDPNAVRPLFTLVQHDAHRLNAHQNVPSVDAAVLTKAMWITGFDLAAFTPTTKKKMRHWASERWNGGSGPRPPRFWVLCKGAAPDFWVDKGDIIDWQTIKAIKLPQTNVRSASGGYKPTGAYDAFEDGTAKHMQAADIDTSKPLFFTQGNAYATRRYRDMLAAAHPNGYTYVYMPANRVAKFQRDFPMAVKAQEGVEDAFAIWSKALTPDQRKAMWLDETYNTAKFKSLTSVEARISDPDIREAIRVAQIDVTALRRRQDQFSYLLSNTKVAGSLMKNPLERYRIFPSRFSPSDLDHIVHYLNTTYKAFQAGVLK